MTLAMSHGERSTEVEHAQPVEVARCDAGHGDDVAGGEARGDDAEEDAAGLHDARGANRSPHSGDGAAMGDEVSASKSARRRR